MCPTSVLDPITHEPRVARCKMLTPPSTFPCTAVSILQAQSTIHGTLYRRRQVNASFLLHAHASPEIFLESPQTLVLLNSTWYNINSCKPPPPGSLAMNLLNLKHIISPLVPAPPPRPPVYAKKNGKLLVFCKIDAYGNPTVPGLLSLAGQMKMGRGLLMVVGLLEGDMVEVGTSNVVL